MDSGSSYQHTTNVNIHHVLCDPYLVSFPFYTIPICLFLKIHRIFIYLSLSFLYTLSVFSVLMDVLSMQVSKGEEVVIQKSAQGHFWL